MKASLFSTGIMIVPKGSVADIVLVAQAAEAAGFDFCLVADEGFHYDVYVMMATIVANTARLRVAPITNPYSRHPAVTAAALASINALAPGRTFLTVVAGGSLALEPMNLIAEKPVVACREMIQIVRALLSGEKRTVEGNQFRLTGAQLQIPAEPVDIWVLGRGLKMVRMGGECADVTVVTGRLQMASTVEAARHGAEAGGRELKLAYMGNVVFRQAIIDQMRPHYTYILPDSPPSVWDELHLSAEWIAELKRIRETEGVKSAARLISDDLLRRCMGVGTPDESAREIRRLAEALNFSYFVMPIMSLDREYALPLIQEAAQIYARAR